MSESEMYDTGDFIRARTWDLHKPDGTQEDRLDALLGALGAYGGERSWQVHQLRGWLASSAAIPAPPALVEQVKKFLETYG